MKKIFLTLFILTLFTNFTNATTISPSISVTAMQLNIDLTRFPYISKRINLSKFLMGENFTIDWGDGTITSNKKKHLYSKKDQYIIKVYMSDLSEKIGLSGCRKSFNLALSLKSISIDNNQIKWSSLKNGFSYCGATNITFKNPNFSATQNLKNLFSVMHNFKGGEWMRTWDVSNITNMSRMFFLSRKFNEDISQWDVSNVKNMEKMFYYAKEFNQNLSQWDVSKVTNMRRMFKNNLSTENYSSTLTGWSKLPLQNNVKLDAYNIKHNLSGGFAKQAITDNYNWTIHDAGLDENCTYTTTTSKCIQVEIDESKLNLFLKHEENDIAQIEHIIFPQYNARIIHLKFLPSANGDYSLFWTSYSSMRDDLIRMTRLDNNGVELVPTKSMFIMGHAASNPDITLLKNDNFIIHWCHHSSQSEFRLFTNQGDEINRFMHGSYPVYQACSNRSTQPAVIIPLDNGGFEYSFGDYNNTFDNQGNPL